MQEILHQELDSFNVSVQDQLAASLNQYDVSTLKSENKILRSKLKQLQSDLQAEQGKLLLLLLYVQGF